MLLQRVPRWALVVLGLLPRLSFALHMGRERIIPKIDTYVINLDSRKDRCECMRHQLAAVPQNVFRQRAVHHSGCPGLKEAEFEKSRTFKDAEKSLFCNNYMIWERAMKTDADFIVILEDDAFLRNGFWDTVVEFVRECKTFDYVLVDPMGLYDRKPKEQWNHWHRDFFNPDGELVEGCSVRGTNAYRRRTRGDTDALLGWWTTTMTIIRREFLPTLIEQAKRQGWGAIDNWWQTFLTEDWNAFGWAANITVQMSVGAGSLIHRAIVESGCSPEVQRTDIGEGSVVEQLAQSSNHRFQLNCH